MNYAEHIAKELNLNVKQVKNTLKLLDEGATIPFISRYRKEATGSLDEVQITQISKLRAKWQEIDERRYSILKSIEKQEKLSPELKEKIESAQSLTELEDIYLPYKPKRRTRATIAREKGLEPLAKIIMKQHENKIESRVSHFISDQVSSEEEALEGARDIIAEWINESEIARKQTRQLFTRQARVYAKLIKGKQEEGEKYKDYFNYEQELKKIPSHRLLAIRRAEKEKIVRVNIASEESKAISGLERIFVKSDNACAIQVKMAIKDAYKRLLSPSIENEFAAISKENADEEAIEVFQQNLQQLLMAAPLGHHRILAIDPGFRTGCKVVCLDEQGNLLHNETIYPHQQQKIKLAIKKVNSLIDAYQIQAIAIGNGTASRETKEFITYQVKPGRNIQIFMVSEDGASIYSASKTAREEFPEYDVTVRGAVSIGRRLMDPLAELVKIDPKSLGIGQYQHDVDQKKLQESLDRVVESCVNRVGVNLNTASKHLLSYVSGLNDTQAQNIVQYRSENGMFRNRNELKKVPRLGPKAFEQCAGFLRIPHGTNPLDGSAVHPESYHVIEKMAEKLNCEIRDLLHSSQLRKQIKLQDFVDSKTGIPTLKDIFSELEKPGRDPRPKAKAIEFSDHVKTIHDLQAGMVLPGIITNITKFGAFVDIGIKPNGLVHISNICTEFISNPADKVKLHQHVTVKVLDVNTARNRIQLSMKGLQ